jgi:radical SAM enzyme (TIGR01210 family)
MARKQVAQVDKITFFCCGSLLNPRETSDSALERLIWLAIGGFPEVRALSVESRAQYVTSERVSRVQAYVGKSRSLEVAIGYETQDPTIRNGLLLKGLGDRQFERALKTLATAGCGVRAYVMLKPTHISHWTDDEWVHEAVATIGHLVALARRHGTGIRVQVNPAYVAPGTKLDSLFRSGGYRVVQFRDVLRVLLQAEGFGVPIQVGLDDEGLAVPGGTFLESADAPEWGRRLLADFNCDQDYSRIRSVAEALLAAEPQR